MKNKTRSVEEILEAHKNWLDGNSGTRLVWNELSEDEKTNLRNADLRYADLLNANLRNADLYNADLCYADLCYANLLNADLRNADLRYANLLNADLCYADLLNADLRYANLLNANLRKANGYHSVCPEIGSFIAFKKLLDNKIAKLEIPEHAKRSSATTRKCRASEANVLEIFDVNDCDEKFDYGCSRHDAYFKYEVGKTVFADSFDEDRFNECSNGIHFLITLQEAIDY